MICKTQLTAKRTLCKHGTGQPIAVHIGVEKSPKTRQRKCWLWIDCLKICRFHQSLGCGHWSRLFPCHCQHQSSLQQGPPPPSNIIIICIVAITKIIYYAERILIMIMHYDYAWGERSRQNGLQLLICYNWRESCMTVPMRIVYILAHIPIKIGQIKMKQISY